MRLLAVEADAGFLPYNVGFTLASCVFCSSSQHAKGSGISRMKSSPTPVKVCSSDDYSARRVKRLKATTFKSLSDSFIT